MALLGFFKIYSAGTLFYFLTVMERSYTGCLCSCHILRNIDQKRVWSLGVKRSLLPVSHTYFICPVLAEFGGYPLGHMTELIATGGEGHSLLGLESETDLGHQAFQKERIIY